MSTSFYHEFYFCWIFTRFRKFHIQKSVTLESFSKLVSNSFPANNKIWRKLRNFKHLIDMLCLNFLLTRSRYYGNKSISLHIVKGKSESIIKKEPHANINPDSNWFVLMSFSRIFLTKPFYYLHYLQVPFILSRI